MTGFGATYAGHGRQVVLLLPADREVLLVREQERTPEHADVHGDKPVGHVARALHQTLLTSFARCAVVETVGARYRPARRSRKCG